MYGPCSQEEYTADSQVGEQHEEPDGRREGIEEGEVTRLPTLIQTERRRREREVKDGVTETDVIVVLKKKGVMSPIPQNVPFGPEEGSILHCTQIVL